MYNSYLCIIYNYIYIYMIHYLLEFFILNIIYKYYTLNNKKPQKFTININYIFTLCIIQSLKTYIMLQCQ